LTSIKKQFIQEKHMIRTPKFFFVITIALVLFSCGRNSSKTEFPVSTESEEAKALFNEAYYLTQIFKEDEAKTKLLKAVEIDKGFGAAYTLLSSLGVNTVSETDKYYDKAIELSFQLNDYEKCLLEIRTSGRDNDVIKRLKNSKKLVELLPNNAIAHQRLAWTYWGTAKIEEMRKSSKNAIQKDKKYVMAYVDLAKSYTFNDPIDYEKAEKYARDALSINKNESFFHVLVGDVLRAQNKLQDAAKKYDDAYKTGTNNFISAAKAGHAYTFIDPTEARKRFDQATNEARNPSQKIGPEYGKVYTYLHENEFQKGYAQLMKLKNKIDSYGFSDEKKQEEISDILWNEYFILSHSGRHDAAKKAINEKRIIDLAIAKKSKNKRAVKNEESFTLWVESHLDIMKGDYDGAKKRLSLLKEMASNESDPKKYDDYYNLMGMASLMSGNAPLGVEYFEKVVGQSNIYFQYFKGLAYKAQGNTTRAKEIFQHVATHNFNTLIYSTVRNRALEEVAKG
jgi:tetratricopeptide (TPR) repeat protein